MTFAELPVGALFRFTHAFQGLGTYEKISKHYAIEIGKEIPSMVAFNVSVIHIGEEPE